MGSQMTSDKNIWVVKMTSDKNTWVVKTTSDKNISVCFFKEVVAQTIYIFLDGFSVL